MDDVAGLLQRLRTHEAAQPRITWYGPGAERVELSGKVTDNWVAKSANLLLEEYDCGAGTRVAIGLPAHWRTVVWMLAVWAAGGEVVVTIGGPADHGVDLLITADGGPDRGSVAEPGPSVPVLRVALPALAPSDVRLYGDAFVPLLPPDLSATALSIDGVAVAQLGELMSRARRAAAERGIASGERCLVSSTSVDPLATWLPVLATGGSVVLHHDPGGLSADQLAALCASEHARVI